MYPDYISAKKMRENYEGNVFSCMGCRSFLTPWKDKNGNYKAMNCDKPLDFSTLYPIIKDYLTTDEQEMFETFIGMMDMFSMDDEAKESMFGEYMDMFKEMF